MPNKSAPCILVEGGQRRREGIRGWREEGRRRGRREEGGRRERGGVYRRKGGGWEDGGREEGKREEGKREEGDVATLRVSDNQVVLHRPLNP